MIRHKAGFGEIIIMGMRMFTVSPMNLPQEAYPRAEDKIDT